MWWPGSSLGTLFSLGFSAAHQEDEHVFKRGEQHWQPLPTTLEDVFIFLMRGAEAQGEKGAKG